MKNVFQVIRKSKALSFGENLGAVLRPAIAILSLLILLSFHISAQTFPFAKQGGGTSTDEGKSIAVDASGNSYVTGYFTGGSATFGSTTITSSMTEDVFVAKYNSSGTLQWAKSGSSLIDYTTLQASNAHAAVKARGLGIALDQSNNAYITGYFNISTTANVNWFLFFSVNSSGTLIETCGITGGGTIEGHAVTVDASNNIYFTGSIVGDMTTYSKAGVITLSNTAITGTSNTNNQHAYVMKFAKTSTNNYDFKYHVFSKSGTGYADEGNGIVLDNNSNINLAGTFQGSTDFGGSSFHTSSGLGDAFVVQCGNPGLLPIWVTQGGSTADDGARAIAFDGSGNLAVSGYFHGTFQIGSKSIAATGNTDGFLAGLDNSGTVNWLNKVGSGGDDAANGVAYNLYGNIWLTGSVVTSAGTGGVGMPNGQGGFTIFYGEPDIFIYKYSATGDFLCGTTVGGNGFDAGYAVAANDGDDARLTGRFDNAYNIVFGSTTINAGSNGIDAFTAQFSCGTSPCTLTVSNQNPIITADVPASFALVSLTSSSPLEFTVHSVPAPSGITQNTLILQFAVETLNSSGYLSPGTWATAWSQDYIPGSGLTTGTVSQLISSYPSYVSAGTANKAYYWRVGIKTYISSVAQPVVWSPINKFILQPAEITIAAETYLTNNSQHTNDINWVYGISYLDDGKISEGIAYIDGLGKSRQVQSKLQSENEIMAVEAAYSEEGGGSVLTLPAPTGNEVSGQARFGYAHRFFDVDSSGVFHDFVTRDFDRELKSTSCNPLAAPAVVDPVSLVGAYYGSGGPDYVDNAEGYPFAYNVGYKSPLQRPMLTAGGVGGTFKMTGGKEYKHFYGSPSQQELDRVFGVTLAPEQENINRTITYDPNGVGNITYKDNEGKVIATALTVCDGGAPSLNALSEDAVSMAAFTVHIDPLKTGIFNPATLENFATSKFFVPCSTGVTLDYEAVFKSFTVDPLPCKECRYDVTVNIVDESCGESVFTLTQDVDPTSTACSSTTDNKQIIDAQTIGLDGPATYIINRTIKPHVDATSGKNIVEQAIDDYIEYVNENKTTLRGQFSTLYNTEEKWYLLRKTKTLINNGVTISNPDLYNVGTLSGTGDTCNLQGVWVDADYNRPRGVTKDENNNYYVVEETNNTIRKITPAGVVSTFAGLSCTAPGYTDDTATTARFSKPYDIVYTRPANFSVPGNLFVADRDNNRVRKVTLDGAVTTFAGSGSQFSSPEGLGFDPVTNDIYVASSGNHKIYKVSQSGTVTHVAGSGSSGSSNNSNPLLATFNHPSDVAVDHSGNIYVADRDNNLIRKISSAGVVTTLAGSGSAASTDGTGASAAFHTPVSLVVDYNGTIFVTDAGSNKIRRVNPSTASVLTIAGSGTAGWQDGVGGSAKFKTPAGLYMDQVNLFAAGTLILADAGNNRIRTIREEGCSGGPCGVGGTSPDYLWYADEADIFDLPASESPYTKLITSLDGDADVNGTPGNEQYKLTSVTLNGAASGGVTTDFIAAYKRQHQVDLTGMISSINVYDIGSSSQLNSTTIVVIDDKKVMLTGESAQGYYLLKVADTIASCSKKCTIEDFAMDCADQCQQQHDGLKAEAVEAFEALSPAVNPNRYHANGNPGGAYTVKELVQMYYPLNDDILNNFIEDDYNLYQKYEDARLAANNFDPTVCLSLCNGTPPGPCETCLPTYMSCVNQNMDDLSNGYDYLMSQWTGSFPFTFDQLMPLTFPTPNTVRAADADLFEKLGKPLFDYIISKIDPSISGNPTIPSKATWETQGGTCGTCYAPAKTLGSVTCLQGPAINVSAFPTILLPLLDAANAQCVADYEGCLSMNGTTAEQTAQLCLQEKNNCLASLDPASANYSTEVTACNSAYSNCIATTPTPPTTVELQRENMIRTSLQKIYPNKDTTFIDGKITEIKTATSSLSIMKLEEYLFDYEQKFSCIADCENQFEEAFNRYIDNLIISKKNEIITEYLSKCVNDLVETFDVSYTQKMYHYTLYNYDKANNLVSTVPPEGVDYIDLATEGSRVPAHRMLSTYKPTSLYTITAEAPDEGKTLYLYDKAGRIRFSQSAEQRERSQSGDGPDFRIFSYTKYDNDMRVIETGEYHDNSAEICYWSLEQFPAGTCGSGMFSVESKVNDISWPTNASNTFEETYIAYDDATLPASTPSSAYAQKYLLNRVAKTWNENATTHYSYDAHGRVTFAVQEINALTTDAPTTNFKYKTIDYIYTTKTSRVDQIIYQKTNLQEEFRHRYTYDDDQRLTKTEVSKNGTTWMDASAYTYYLHGPVKDIDLGNHIQDIDLVYNINGWLKAINNPVSGTWANDANEDNSATSGHYSKDVFAEAINYYNDDYNRTGVGLNAGSVTVPGSGSNIVSNNKGKDLFNGNISSVVSMTLFSGLTSPPATNIDNMTQAYRYDLLNRLTDVYVETCDAGSFAFRTTDPTNNPYKVQLTYDANGNINTLVRRTLSGGTGAAMDELDYKYAQTTTDYRSNVKKTNNKLATVGDAVGAATVGDIGDQSTGYVAGTPGTHNYIYDKKGRIKRDKTNGLTATDAIEWTVYDKVKKITKSDGTVITFTYDSKQQRISKKVDETGSNNDVTTYYTYDANGMLMATYDYQYSGGSYAYKLLDEHVYGLSRVGTCAENLALVSSPSAPATVASNLRFEISDHLGSVRAVVQGNKDANNKAIIVSLADYSDFGWTMQGRNVNLGIYRYGYQGSEHDPEINNSANSYYTTNFRMMDVRLGRFFSADPVSQPYQSAYCSMDNNPTLFTDREGGFVIPSTWSTEQKAFAQKMINDSWEILTHNKSAREAYLKWTGYSTLKEVHDNVYKEGQGPTLSIATKDEMPGLFQTSASGEKMKVRADIMKTPATNTGSFWLAWNFTHDAVHASRGLQKLPMDVTKKELKDKGLQGNEDFIKRTEKLQKDVGEDIPTNSYEAGYLWGEDAFGGHPRKTADIEENGTFKNFKDEPIQPYYDQYNKTMSDQLSPEILNKTVPPFIYTLPAINPTSVPTDATPKDSGGAPKDIPDGGSHRNVRTL